MPQMIQPTPEVYSELQMAFDHFNKELFDSQLPDCLITLQRERKTYGYYSSKRYIRLSLEQTDEIALNPSYFYIRSIQETLSTLAHEQVHMWQDHFGQPGRRGYHNHEWASKMVAIGLMPTDTGEPGGRRVGERVTHMIISGGRFDAACALLLTKDFRLSWYDRFPPDRPKPVVKPPTASGRGFVDDIDEPEDDGGQDQVEGSDRSPPGGMSAFIELPPVGGVNKSNRAKYRCPKCTGQLWGKPGMYAYCGGRMIVRGAVEEVKEHEVTRMDDVTYQSRQGGRED